MIKKFFKEKAFPIILLGLLYYMPMLVWFYDGFGSHAFWMAFLPGAFGAAICVFRYGEDES
jgi:hypothetical protein